MKVRDLVVRAAEGAPAESQLGKIASRCEVFRATDTDSIVANVAIEPSASDATLQWRWDASEFPQTLTIHAHLIGGNSWRAALDIRGSAESAEVPLQFTVGGVDGSGDAIAAADAIADVTVRVVAEEVGRPPANQSPTTDGHPDDGEGENAPAIESESSPAASAPLQPQKPSSAPPRPQSGGRPNSTRTPAPATPVEAPASLANEEDPRRSPDGPAPSNEAAPLPPPSSEPQETPEATKANAAAEKDEMPPQHQSNHGRSERVRKNRSKRRGEDPNDEFTRRRNKANATRLRLIMERQEKGDELEEAVELRQEVTRYNREALLQRRVMHSRAKTITSIRAAYERRDRAISQFAVSNRAAFETHEKRLAEAEQRREQLNREMQRQKRERHNQSPEKEERGDGAPKSATAPSGYLPPIDVRSRYREGPTYNPKPLLPLSARSHALPIVPPLPAGSRSGSDPETARIHLHAVSAARRALDEINGK